MKTITAWAICDTDGNRHEPIPLSRHIYSTSAQAEQVRRYDGFSEEYYPILQVTISVHGLNDAAPELLEACNLALSALCDIDYTVYSNDKLQNYMDIIVSLKKAIAKAKG